ncbi:PhzF family phenazine biosynthesis protein [Lutimonas sp.]|uniref:PhzF family phenazine biosynthesis protein n=1 Tax=Lutimonas sp. TaxID=1872403 RepID=UPI003D9BE568
MNNSKQTMYQIDAFSETVFGGNPAAVCILETWLSEEIMQNIAAENNLAETAFVVKKGNDFEIRWFTPTIEVALCGHATLASAFVLFEHLNYSEDRITFHSMYSGELSVTKNKDVLTLDFPQDIVEKVSPPENILKAFEKSPLEVFKGKTDFLLLYENQKDIEACDPNLYILKNSPARGIIITAKGDDVDFVSRFFAPGSGVDEDPVTGSAHTTLAPFWSNRLGKNLLRAEQLSKRRGKLLCEISGDRVKISGKARTYLVGEIFF